MNKPPYKVPSMAEIQAIPWNGFNVISTFSGCGGSCLGYRMAGYRVLYANEFIPAAQETYKANHPNSYLDKRDIRQVKAQEILDIIGLKKGEIDLMDGSPPCAAFSTAGKREKGWGKVKQYSDTKQRVDDLFFEYARLLKDLQPKVFVAENVSGLIKGTAKGYFIEIIKTLKDCGYNVKCKVLDAQWLGVPQMRQRTIFVGVRNDLGLDPVHPKPFAYQYCVKDAWSGIGEQIIDDDIDFRKYKLYEHWKKRTPGRFSDDTIFNLKRLSWSRPSATMCQTWGRGTAAITHPEKPRYPTALELRRICSFPDDFILIGGYAQQWERLGRSVPPVMMSHIAKTIQKGILEKL